MKSEEKINRKIRGKEEIEIIQGKGFPSYYLKGKPKQLITNAWTDPKY